ncbi:MAG: hypothetical protein HYX60_02165 [Legionella longbeachae]|nr:hypothetical protein [Legionella longbeachae]
MQLNLENIQKINTAFQKDDLKLLNSVLLAEYISYLLFNIINGTHCLEKSTVLKSGTYKTVSLKEDEGAISVFMKHEFLFDEEFNIEKDSLLFRALSVYDVIRQRKDEKVLSLAITETLNVSLTMLHDLILKLEVTLTKESMGLVNTVKEVYYQRAQGIMEKMQYSFLKPENVVNSELSEIITAPTINHLN